jgi:uncharacterized protein (TIGR03435 family)
MMPAIDGMMIALSGSVAASIAAKATAVMALGLIGARLARRSRAAVRHAILAASFGVLLVLPAASIVAPPVRIAAPAIVQNRTASPPGGATDVDALLTPWNADLGATPTIPRISRLSAAALLAAAWFAGAMLSLLPVAMGLWKVRSLRRCGLPWRQGQSAADRLALEAGARRRIEVLLHEALPGPMTCGAVHPAIVLPPDAQAWEEEELNRALVHELEHVRRCDWVSQCLARAVCAVYWFHPLVWMAWRRLALEAERSCDDAVLQRSEAAAYAEQLVGLARRLVLAARTPAAKPTLLAMANRTDLTRRVRAVLDSRQQRGRAGMLPLVLVCAAAAVLVLTMSPLTVVAAPQSAPALSAANGPQTIAPPSGSAEAPKFEAVSVKLIDPDSGSLHSSEHPDPGRLSMTGSMHRFILRAFGITDSQLGGEPDWFKTHLYSIEAVTSTPASVDQLMLMLRGVLADRFQLKLREEDRDLPVYILEVAPGGPKFKELKPGEIPHDDPAPPDTFARSFTSVKELMNSLNGVYGGRLTVDRPVVDRTHLTGSYNMHLLTEMERQTDDFGGRTLRFPNLSHDLQSQMGLKLAPSHVPMPYFVVEKAALPTPN